MPTRYDPCDSVDPAVRLKLEALIARNHPGLGQAGALVCLLFASNDEGKPAIKKPGGYPAAAKVRVIPLKDRAAGREDAEILLDRREWEALDEGGRWALLDHQLEHLLVRREGNKPAGKILTDASGRPKLLVRPHDFEVEWFDAVARRHRDHAPEVRAVKQFLDVRGQFFFGFAGDRPGVRAEEFAGSTS